MKKRIESFFLYGCLFSLACLLMGAKIMTDPTRPPDLIYNPQASSHSGAIALTAIFTYPTFRLAIINGNLVKVGDKINELTITNITPNTVELLGSQNTTQTLMLLTPIKQAAGPATNSKD